jgi:hypothetical protein
MFVVDHVLNVELPIGSSTLGYFLVSLTDFISQQFPSDQAPKYLNIRGIISAYKSAKWIPGIIELPMSGFEVDWYVLSFPSVH